MIFVVLHGDSGTGKGEIKFPVTPWAKTKVLKAGLLYHKALIHPQSGSILCTVLFEVGSSGINNTWS